MPHGQDDATSLPDVAVCVACERDFIVPVSVVDLIDDDRCVVELWCTNCGVSALRVHDDHELMELDRRLDAAQALMQEAVAVFELSEELDRIDRFVRALRAGHLLPEDF